MQSLNPNIINRLDVMLTMELEHIHKGLHSVNIKIGKYYIENALRTFKEYELVSIYGEGIPVYTDEFKYFVFGLIDGIEEKHQRMALNEIILPAIKSSDDIELVEMIEKQFKDLIDKVEEEVIVTTDKLSDSVIDSKVSMLDKFLNIFRKDRL